MSYCSFHLKISAESAVLNQILSFRRTAWFQRERGGEWGLCLYCLTKLLSSSSTPCEGIQNLTAEFIPSPRVLEKSQLTLLGGRDHVLSLWVSVYFETIDVDDNLQMDSKDVLH